MLIKWLSVLDKWGTYNEESFSGSLESLVDPWTEYVRFAEIYYPDAPQEDTIYVIEVVPIYMSQTLMKYARL